MPLKRRRNWLLVDADDTVVGVNIHGEVKGTSEAYDYVIDTFVDLMEVEGFDGNLARQFQAAWDREACAKYGFGDKSRFPDSFAAAYAELARLKGEQPDPRLLEGARALGYKVFTDFPYEALPGAIGALHALSDRYSIAIVTKGEDEEQRKKVFESGCFVYADAVMVLDKKSEGEWRKVVRQLQIPMDAYASSWAIGNAIKSDINPPLRLGFNAIHLTGPKTWGFEASEYETPSVGRQLLKVNDIKEAAQFLMGANSTSTGV